jgi:hypothetical protein
MKCLSLEHVHSGCSGLLADREGSRRLDESRIGSAWTFRHNPRIRVQDQEVIAGERGSDHKNPGEENQTRACWECYTQPNAEIEPVCEAALTLRSQARNINVSNGPEIQTRREVANRLDAAVSVFPELVRASSAKRAC